MLFEELTFQDFLVFRGENTLRFPPTDAGSSLVLVLAPNNGGKTNVIRALRFLLYGDLLGHEGHVLRLINDAARHEVSRGGAEGWVQATVPTQSGERLTFRRRVAAQLESPDDRFPVTSCSNGGRCSGISSATSPTMAPSSASWSAWYRVRSSTTSTFRVRNWPANSLPAAAAAASAKAWRRCCTRASGSTPRRDGVRLTCGQ